MTGTSRSTSTKPIAVPDEASAGFWEAAASHQLAVQRCQRCGWLSYPARQMCPSCLDDKPEFEWHCVSGAGRLKTWTVMRDSFLPGFAEELPYVVGDVELPEQEGLRVIARIVGAEEGELHLGMDLQVAFDDVGERLAVPYFVGTTS